MKEGGTYVFVYKEHGDLEAPLILFLHGGGVSGWMWDEQIQYFTHYHCIVPDLPEHGKTGGERHFSVKGSAEQCIQLIVEKAKGKKVIVVGFSLGAQILIQMLSMKPNIADIAVINSALSRPVLSGRKLLRSTVKLSFPLIKKRWFSKLQAKTLYVGKDDFEKYYEESCHLRLDTLLRVLDENMSFEIPAGFSQVKGKILVTVGEREKVVMKKSVRDLVEVNSNCTGVMLQGMGHGAPLGMPQFFNQMVEKWISEGELLPGCQLIS